MIVADGNSCKGLTLRHATTVACDRTERGAGSGPSVVTPWTRPHYTETRDHTVITAGAPGNPSTRCAARRPAAPPFHDYAGPAPPGGELKGHELRVTDSAGIAGTAMSGVGGLPPAKFPIVGARAARRRKPPCPRVGIVARVLFASVGATAAAAAPAPSETLTYARATGETLA